MLVFNLAISDETFQYARDPYGRGPTSYLDNMYAYGNITQGTDILEELEISDTQSSYEGMDSRVKLLVLKLI